MFFQFLYFRIVNILNNFDLKYPSILILQILRNHHQSLVLSVVRV